MPRPENAAASEASVRSLLDTELAARYSELLREGKRLGVSPRVVLRDNPEMRLVLEEFNRRARAHRAARDRYRLARLRSSGSATEEPGARTGGGRAPGSNP
jgi:hypothetical protein